MKTILFPLYIIKQYERGIVEFLGRYTRFVEPGFHVQWPLLNLTRVRDVREHTMMLEEQPVITRDNVEILVDGIIWVRPGLTTEDIQKTFYNIDDWRMAIIELAKTNLRQEFGELSLDESLTARERISENLQTSLDSMVAGWGLKVCKVEIQMIDPPEDIKAAMHKEKTAEQERRAMKLLATGKYEAAEQEKLAAIQLAEGKAKAIQLVNEAAEKYFRGNAKELKQLEVTESSLKNNAKIIVTEKGISPHLILGDLPVVSKTVDANDSM